MEATINGKELEFVHEAKGKRHSFSCVDSGTVYRAVTVDAESLKGDNALLVARDVAKFAFYKDGECEHIDIEQVKGLASWMQGCAKK